jgi:hypothetical protein
LTASGYLKGPTFDEEILLISVWATVTLLISLRKNNQLLSAKLNELLTKHAIKGSAN